MSWKQAGVVAGCIIVFPAVGLAVAGLAGVFVGMACGVGAGWYAMKRGVV